MKKKILAILLAGLLSVGIANASSTVDVSPDASDITEINQIAPGSSKTFLGTRLRGLLQIGATSITTSGVKDLDESYGTIKFTTGASDYGTFDAGMDDGYAGQLLTLVLVTDNAGNVDVTPDTKTGFTSIQLNDAGDSVTFRFVDSTTGWVLAGQNGATINQ